MTEAMAVPKDKCTIWSGANICAVNSAERIGTNIIPPPMPSSPARKPMKAPASRYKAKNVGENDAENEVKSDEKNVAMEELSNLLSA